MNKMSGLISDVFLYSSASFLAALDIGYALAGIRIDPGKEPNRNENGS